LDLSSLCARQRNLFLRVCMGIPRLFKLIRDFKLSISLVGSGSSRRVAAEFPPAILRRQFEKVDGGEDLPISLDGRPSQHSLWMCTFLILNFHVQACERGLYTQIHTFTIAIKQLPRAVSVRMSLEVYVLILWLKVELTWKFCISDKLKCNFRLLKAAEYRVRGPEVSPLQFLGLHFHFHPLYKASDLNQVPKACSALWRGRICTYARSGS